MNRRCGQNFIARCSLNATGPNLRELGPILFDPSYQAAAGARDLLADEMLDLLAGQGLHIDILLDSPEAHQAFRE